MEINEIILLREMSPEVRAIYQYSVGRTRRNPNVAQVLNLFGLHRFYLGQPGTGIAQLLLVPFIIGAVWILIDLFKIRSLTERVNLGEAQAIASALDAWFANPKPETGWLTTPQSQM